LHQNVIFTIVPEGQDVREVYLNKKTGICAADISGKILLGCSTIDTVTSLQVKDHISQSFPTALVYDTPISGGVSGAEAATLAIYVGIRDSDPNFTFLKELLLLIGKNIIPCGGPSLGLAVKLSNNYLAGVIVCLGVASRSKLERDQSTPD
jgi:3-hydroxyisobutyrate dehydrogenase